MEGDSLPSNDCFDEEAFTTGVDGAENTDGESMVGIVGESIDLFCAWTTGICLTLRKGFVGDSSSRRPETEKSRELIGDSSTENFKSFVELAD